MSTQDVTSREGLSRGAEALSEKLADETGEHDKGMRALAARDIARAIVEDRGIYQRHVDALINAVLRAAQHNEVEAGRLTEVRDFVSTLLELAGADHD